MRPETSPGTIDNPKRYRGELGRHNTEPTSRTLRWLAVVLRHVLKLVITAEVRGGENIPRSGPVIFVPNHISSLDPPVVGVALAYQGRWPHFLARANLFDVPIVGRLLRNADQIPVYRGSTQAREALVAADAALAQGRALVIYPEGTITFDPQEWPMAGHTGAARLALRTGAPVVPIGQWGASLVLPPRKIRPLRPRRATATLICGRPVDLSDLGQAWSDKAAVSEATLRIMDAITAVTEQARGESAPADRWHPALARRVPRAEAIR